MDEATIKALLAEVAEGKISPGEAVEKLRTLPFEDLGYAKLDHHRTLRRGHPEPIFASGKTAAPVVDSVGRMKDPGSNGLVPLS